MDIIFDSNIWIALFNKNDSHHEKVSNLFLEPQSIYVPEYIILETTSVLQLRASKQIANMFAQMIIETKQVEVLYTTEAFFNTVLKLFQKQQKKLAFVDCALLVLSKDYKIYTFDKALNLAIEQKTNEAK